MKLSVAFLLVLVPLFKVIGALAGVPDLADQFKDVIPHIQAVVDFVVVLVSIYGSLMMLLHSPGEITKKVIGLIPGVKGAASGPFRSSTGN